MKVTVLCSDKNHPVMPCLESWAAAQRGRHDVEIVRSQVDLSSGDFLFLVSCSELIAQSRLEYYRHALVLHASDLPAGRGWSPHIWEIIGGAEEITLSLLEAAAGVDSGRIWFKQKIPIPKNALWNEVNELLFRAELELMSRALLEYEGVRPYQQSDNVESTYYRKRTADDSRIDIHRSIAEQFDLIRMCDPERYPATFEIHGTRYRLTLEKTFDD